MSKLLAKYRSVHATGKVVWLHYYSSSGKYLSKIQMFYDCLEEVLLDDIEKSQEENDLPLCPINDVIILVDFLQLRKPILLLGKYKP